MFKKYLLASTLILTTTFAICQTAKIDSLISLDKQFPANDSNKVNRYADIAFALGSIDPVKGLAYKNKQINYLHAHTHSD